MNLFEIICTIFIVSLILFKDEINFKIKDEMSFQGIFV